MQGSTQKVSRIFIYIDRESTEEQQKLSFIDSSVEQRDRELASIHDLEWEMEEQKRLRELGLDYSERLSPWGENSATLVLTEGDYVWSRENERYEKIS